MFSHINSNVNPDKPVSHASHGSFGIHRGNLVTRAAFNPSPLALMSATSTYRPAHLITLL